MFENPSFESRICYLETKLKLPFLTTNSYNSYKDKEDSSEKLCLGRARTDPEEAAMELVGEGTQHGAGDTKTKVKQKHFWN